MYIPDHIINNFKEKGLEKNTIINYTACLKKYMNNEWNESKIFDLSTISEHIKLLPIKRRESFLRALTYATDSIYNINKQYIKNQLTIARDESMLLSIKALKTKKEEKVTFEEILKISTVKQKNFVNDLISKLYTLEVPLRADTWSTVKIIDAEDSNLSSEYNYINLETGLLYLNKYKTVKTYGKKTILLNDQLISYIKENWYKNNLHIGNPCRFLLPNRNGDRITAHNLNLRLKDIFGYGSSVLRHSYISYCRKKGDSEEDMKKLASRMNTSLRQVCLVYDDTNAILD